MKLLTLFAIFSLFLSPLANAYELAAAAGVQTMSVSVDTTGSSADGGTGFYAGLMGYMDLGGEHYVRSGLLLSQRKYDLSSATLKYEIETLNLDAPITYMVLLNDMFGVFGGARVGINLSNKCESNSTLATCALAEADNIETLAMAAEIGGQFRFTPNIALELVFNLGLTDIAKSVKWGNSIVLGGMFLF